MKPLLLFVLFTLSITVSAQDKTKLLSDIKILSSAEFEGRKTGTPGNQKAAEFIVTRFKEIGLSSYASDFRHPFTFNNRQGEAKDGVNLIGYIKGKTARAIVISAHYDHLGTSNGQLYYGADDNASGVAALLALAEYFKKNPPENTLLFIAFDAEESGLRGASAFVKEPAIPKAQIALNVNMDMIAHNDKGELYASGTYKHPFIKQIIQGADQNSGIKLLFGHDLPNTGIEDWTMQSDQGPFAKENIPFVYFGVEDHKDYHKPTDTFENINPEFYYGAAKVILESLKRLDKSFTVK